MANRVKDILIDIGSCDLTLASECISGQNYYDVVWGGLFPDDGDELYANIYIPLSQASSLGADAEGRYVICFKSGYYPKSEPFTLRLVTKSDGQYVKISQRSCKLPVTSLAMFNGHEIHASELYFVNSDGYYLALLSYGSEKNVASIYSGEDVDFAVGVSDDQAGQLLSLCAPGKYHRYPFTGIDVTKYINAVVNHTNLSQVVYDEFEKDGAHVQSVGFDSSVGKIDVKFGHLVPSEETADLFDVSGIDVSALDITDDMLCSAAERISLEELEAEYDAIDFGIGTPKNSLRSCFANGIWVGGRPWTGKMYWRGELDVPNNIYRSCHANEVWVGGYPWTGDQHWKGVE